MTQQFQSEVYTQNNWKQGLKYLYTNIQSSITHNSQKVETTLMSMNKWISKIWHNL